MPSVFSAFATRLFDELGIWIARGFRIAGTQRGSIPFSVNGQGYVGVGRSEASFPVHVVMASGTSLGMVVAGRTPGVRIHNTQTTVTTGDILATLEAYSDDPSGNFPGVGGRMVVVSESSFGSSYGVAFYTNNDMTAPLERVRITSGGRVGIGTTSPAAPLDVVGNAQVQGNAYVNSLLGVGTTSPVFHGDFRGRVGVNAADNSATGALLARGRSTDSGIAGRFTNAGFVNGSLGSSVTLAQGSIAGDSFSYLQATQAGATQVAPLHLNPSGGRVGIGPAVTPASATAAVNAGEIFWDGSFLYVAVGANSIKRVGIATW